MEEPRCSGDLRVLVQLKRWTAEWIARVFVVFSSTQEAIRLAGRLFSKHEERLQSRPRKEDGSDLQSRAQEAENGCLGAGSYVAVRGRG